MSDNIFTASNGVQIRVLSSALKGVEWRPRATGKWGLVQWFGETSNLDRALAEWYQHRRDAELGRWRDPENPNMAVYPISPTIVRVLDEMQGLRWEWGLRDTHLPNDSVIVKVARRYFAAHPEPKTWEAAPAGELWEITIAPGRYRAISDGTGAFIDAGGSFWEHDEITTATRLYPKEES